MRRLALVGLLLTACGSSTGPTRNVRITAQVCGLLCDARDPSGSPRGAGDFTGLDCATEARIRLYGVNANGSVSPAAEHCESLAGPNELVDLFNVQSGIPTGVPVGSGARAMFTPKDELPSRVLAEIALYAPGSAKCPADGNFVALGRSAAIELASADKLDVPLGCHTMCGVPHTPTLRFVDLGGGPRSTIPQSKLGELFAYSGLYASNGSCTADPLAETSLGALEFRAFEGGNIGADGKASATYGVDASPFGGCVAAAVPTSPATQYACLDDAASSSPVGYLVPDAYVQAARDLMVFGQSSTTGTLVLQVVDGGGGAQAGAFVSSPGVVSAYPDTTWKADEQATATNANGIVVIPGAPFGEYRAYSVDGLIEGRRYLGGGPPGTITTARIVLLPR